MYYDSPRLFGTSIEPFFMLTVMIHAQLLHKATIICTPCLFSKHFVQV